MHEADPRFRDTLQNIRYQTLELSVFPGAIKREHQIYSQQKQAPPEGGAWIAKFPRLQGRLDLESPRFQ